MPEIALNPPLSRGGGGRLQVSIPFIAGQWSLLPSVCVWHTLLPLSQSPSLRGSGRFVDGATSWCSRRRVSIPFIAGQWSLHSGVRRAHGARRVSIPFIAGQWSLQAVQLRKELDATSLNPLHCGAVVASMILDMITTIADASLNPLHCGAVVASHFAHLRSFLKDNCLNPLHCGAVVASALGAARDAA